MKKLSLFTLLLVSLSAPTFAWKDIAHFVSLPLIDGSGIYSSVMAIRDGELGATKAAGVTTLALLATNSTFGALKVFGPEDSQPKFRRIHRVIGFAVTAAAVWLSVQASVDDNTKNSAPAYVSYGYTALTTVPLIIFAF